MAPINRLEWALFNASQDFKKAMERAVVKHIQFMNAAFHQIRMYPITIPGLRKRVILVAKAKSLITMDHEQINATRSYQIAKNLAHLDYKKATQPKAPVSAWFGGEYDERTYY